MSRAGDATTIGYSMPLVNRLSLQGRPLIERTVLARVMNRRHIIRAQVAALLGLSERSLFNCMAGTIPLPTRRLHLLCDLLDMEPEELVDAKGFLLPAVTS